jgi:hypothetical protein
MFYIARERSTLQGGGGSAAVPQQPIKELSVVDIRHLLGRCWVAGWEQCLWCTLEGSHMDYITGWDSLACRNIWFSSVGCQSGCLKRVIITLFGGGDLATLARIGLRTNARGGIITLFRGGASGYLGESYSLNVGSQWLEAVIFIVSSAG